MDKKFLNKVVDQIVSETMLNHYMGEIQFPFSSSSYSPPLSHPFPSYFLLPFYSEYSKHCRDVYGLNDDEIEYVWKEYRGIIKDKINSNG